MCRYLNAILYLLWSLSLQSHIKLALIVNPNTREIFSLTYSNATLRSRVILVCACARRCSPRVESLAEAKTVPSTYRPERSALWQVTENAINGQATPRVQQLARPRSSAAKKDDYDPYKVGAFSLKTCFLTCSVW